MEFKIVIPHPNILAIHHNTPTEFFNATAMLFYEHVMYFRGVNYDELYQEVVNSVNLVCEIAGEAVSKAKADEAIRLAMDMAETLEYPTIIDKYIAEDEVISVDDIQVIDQHSVLLTILLTGRPTHPLPST